MDAMELIGYLVASIADKGNVLVTIEDGDDVKECCAQEMLVNGKWQVRILPTED